LALAHNQPGPAAEVYQRLADALEHAGDYTGAKATYLTAFNFCQANDVPATAQLCMACLAVVLYQTGEWDRAATIGREVLAAPATRPRPPAGGRGPGLARRPGRPPHPPPRAAAGGGRAGPPYRTGRRRAAGRLGPGDRGYAEREPRLGHGALPVHPAPLERAG